MQTQLVRIGKSRGVLIPQALIEEASLDGPLRMRVVDSGLLLERAADHPRAGWAEAARHLVERDAAVVLDDPFPTVFDESEWIWE